LQKKSDILIAGAGIIGLSLALELHSRGAQVTVLERDTALAQASTAAAGMLAANDPHNPLALEPLSRLSIHLYSGFLEKIAALSGIAVPYQTSVTHQYVADGSITRLAEHSLDPRQLAVALLAAVRATDIDLREHTELKFTEEWPSGVAAHCTSGDRISVHQLVYATGSWTSTDRLRRLSLPVSPRKGQMLRVLLPDNLNLREVHRAEDIYIVPRLYGPHAGSALIGATVEDAGFDTTVQSTDLANLRHRASRLIPTLASETDAPTLESWAGLRPATPDNLPILGRIEHSEEFLATGHFRNGILLAPATAVVLADLIQNRTPSVDLQPFTPTRFL